MTSVTDVAATCYFVWSVFLFCFLVFAFSCAFSSFVPFLYNFNLIFRKLRYKNGSEMKKNKYKKKKENKNKGEIEKKSIGLPLKKRLFNITSLTTSLFRQVAGRREWWTLLSQMVFRWSSAWVGACWPWISPSFGSICRWLYTGRPCILWTGRTIWTLAFPEKAFTGSWTVAPSLLR